MITRFWLLKNVNCPIARVRQTDAIPPIERGDLAASVPPECQADVNSDGVPRPSRLLNAKHLIELMRRLGPISFSGSHRSPSPKLNRLQIDGDSSAAPAEVIHGFPPQITGDGRVSVSR
jgi:hypothetical protein